MPLLYNLPIPESVWDDFLNPDVSSMECELGLKRYRHEPFFRKVGKGGQRLYTVVPSEVALDLAEYLDGRASTLLGQGVDDPYDPWEKASRSTYRAAVKLARRIKEQAK